ncbi:MAG: hypothetical protein AB1445_15850 [Bacillota bacterium]
MEDLQTLLVAIAETGRASPSIPSIHELEFFRPFFPRDRLDQEMLDVRDGACTRRELIARYLLLNAVLDQGPDIKGIRHLLIGVLNALYRREIRVLHQPLSFFREIGVSIDQIVSTHETVKTARARVWADENNTQASRYNLFMDNSTQALCYAIFRWGVPLLLPVILERDCRDESGLPTALLDYLENYPSAEKMSVGLKDHPRYGLGKAVGDKACHLFAKWYCSSFALTRRVADPRWGPFSYEVPFDSNAGRVLWRAGFFLRLASLEEYVAAQAVQVGSGKGGLDYIRVTNIRDMGVTACVPASVHGAYVRICTEHLAVNSRPPRKIQIQRMPHALLIEAPNRGDLGIADLDEGLIHIGTTYCFNHNLPRCADCPIGAECRGRVQPELIQKYRT